jgi:hypothetical protein
VDIGAVFEWTMNLYRSAEKGDRIAYWEGYRPGRWVSASGESGLTGDEGERTEDLVLNWRKTNFGRSGSWRERSYVSPPPPL